MKRILITTTCLLLAATALQPQTTVKPASKAAGLGKEDAVSNEEMNLRAYIELLRTDFRKTRSQILGEVLALDADQSVKFWPIYKEFEAEYMSLGDQIVALLKGYAEHYDSLTDATADQLANQVLSIEQQRTSLKKKYYGRLKDGLGAVTAARFLQIENQLERISDLQIAAGLPVIRQR